MKLTVAGHPLHTRSLTVTLRAGEGDQLDLDGAVVDLRKCGFVPTAGFLQPAGIVHHMTIDASLSRESRVVDRFIGAQPTRPFDPCAFTGGECCSDPLPRLRELEGRAIDAEFVPALRHAFGGPRGCSHLLTLAQLMASSVPYALDRDTDAGAPVRRPRERLFHRAVEIDGYEITPDVQQIIVQLTDLHFAPTPETAAPMEHFGTQTEVRISARVDLERDLAMSHLEAFERKRSYEQIESARFLDRSADIAFLEGQGVMGGMSRRVLDTFGPDADDLPMVDALLMLAPGFLQCLASLSERWPERAKRDSSILGVTGRPGSCWMWRTDGPVMQSAEGRLIEDER